MCGRVLIFVALSWLCYGSNGQACIFPDYLQAGDTGDQREWRGKIVLEEEDSYTLYITFHDYVMKAVVSGRSRDTPSPYTRECMGKVSEDTFVVSHREDGQEVDMFACLQIIKRSAHVIQLKETDLHPDADAEMLCAEGHFNMVYPYKWPLVNYIGLMGVTEPCPLVGGFNIRVYDPKLSPGDMHCNALEGETRLESECEMGEGMEFQFRHQMCVPRDMQMKVSQRMYCLASWTESVYTFTVLRHDRVERLYLLRYTPHDEFSNVAFLFSDLAADTDRRPEPHGDYLRLDIVVDKTRQTGTLCMDNYEGCKVWKHPCQEQGSLQQLTCPRRCGLCDDTKPSMCMLPRKLQGQYMEDGLQGQRIYNVDAFSLLVQNMSRLECVQWDPSEYRDPDRLEQMTVTTFQNGCKPRYQCLQLYRRSSSIIRYRLSQPQTWPFDRTTGYNVDCTLFNYRDDPGTRGGGVRSRHYKILVSMTERVYVKCLLPPSRHFEVSFFDNTRSPASCNGTLTTDTLTSPTKLTLWLNNCGSEHPQMQQFACLDSSTRGLRDDRMIVTESLAQRNELRCWLFPSYTSGKPKFYLLPASMCNEGSRDRIQQGHLEPLAVFTEFPVVIPERASIMDSKYKNIVLDDKGNPSGKTYIRRADNEYQVVVETRNSSKIEEAKHILFSVLVALIVRFY